MQQSNRHKQLKDMRMMGCRTYLDGVAKCARV